MDAVLGTAGHIDHGKTSLIRCLTGINCDRLDEEKRRGITIELGFAWLDLPDGRRLGIVDVPGHERFVKNMVAGAAGIDCMLLVIAADEGIMPQTREHLDICSLLGVRNGIVVLTKKDMVDEEWLEMVKEDVSGNLKGTFLEGAPILTVSSATGEGIYELKQAIFQLVKSLRARTDTDIMRLPVDRVFTLKGHGTVVTGTIVSGDCRQGEDLCLMPSGRPMRARSLQVHGNSVEEAHHGQRCAMNLQGIDVTEIERGDTVCRPGSLFPAKRWIGSVTCLHDSPHPIRQRMEVHFHHGAKECAARILFRDRDELAPGEEAIAEIHLSQPLAGIFGDRFVMRAHSPLQTIAGGILLDPLPAVLRKRDPLFREKLATLEKMKEQATSYEKNAQGLVKSALSLRPLPGATEKQLAVFTGLTGNELASALAELQTKGEVICWDSDSRSWIDKGAFANCLSDCKRRAMALHEKEPLKAFFAHNAFCAGWGDSLPQKFNQKVLEEAVKCGILKAEANGLKLASHVFAPDKEQAGLLANMQTLYQDDSYSPPTAREAAESLGTDARSLAPLLTHLCETGKLVKIQEGFYYGREALDKILAEAKTWLEAHGNLDIAAMKAMFGVTRKYAVPLLEYMDSIKMTVRIGNERKLRK